MPPDGNYALCIMHYALCIKEYRLLLHFTPLSEQVKTVRNLN